MARVCKYWDKYPNSRPDAKDYVSHNGKSYNEISPQEYGDAVQNKLDDYLKSKGKTSAEDLTDQELMDFVKLIKDTKEKSISEYNEAVAAEILETTGEGVEAAEELEAIGAAIDVDIIVLDVEILIK